MAPYVGATGKPTILVGDSVPHDPGVARVRVQGEPGHPRRDRSTGMPSVDLDGQQRPPGPLPVRRLTGDSDVRGAAHLRDPRRDRAILARIARRAGAVAWLVARGVGGLPAGRYLHHDGGSGPFAASRSPCSSPGWVLMIVAMMLPSSIPLVLTFAALVGRRRRPGRLVALLLAGYLVVWAGFGLRRGSSIAGSTPPSMRSPWLAATPGDHRNDARWSPGCGSSARSATAASTSAAARWGSSSTAGGARPSAREASRWGSPTGRSASAAAGR